MTTNKTPAKAEETTTLVSRIPENMQAFVLGKVQRSGESANTEMAFSLLSAGSADDLFGENKPVKWLANEVYRVNGIRSLNPSDFPDTPLGVYAVLDVTDSDGTNYVVVTGGEQNVLGLLKADYEGWLPRTLRMTVNRTKSGFEVQKLVNAEFEQGW